MGNGILFGDVIYDTAAKVMKQAGAKKVAALAYGAASSSVASAKAFMNYAVPGVGLDPVYTNTAIDFGTPDVSPSVLGIKNAGADAVYLPMAAATNVAVVQGLQQNGVDMKASLLAHRVRPGLPRLAGGEGAADEHVLPDGYSPVEVPNAATKKFQADLKKYAELHRRARLRRVQRLHPRRPDHQGLRERGQEPHPPGDRRRRARGRQVRPGRSGCQPVDVSLEGRGHASKTSCGWFMQVKDGKFVPYPEEREADQR